MKLVWTAAMLVAVSTGAAAQMAVSYEWKREHRCSTTSPALAVSNVPDGAKTLEVRLTDNDVPSYNHGGGSFPADGKDVQIPSGALKQSYTGPCPPNFSSFGHDYQFSVKALGADGAVLATALAIRTFSAAKVPQ